MKPLMRCMGLVFLFLMSQTFSVEAKPPVSKAKVDTKWEGKADLNNDGIVDDKELRLWKEKHPGAEE